MPGESNTGTGKRTRREPKQSINLLSDLPYRKFARKCYRESMEATLGEPRQSITSCPLRLEKRASVQKIGEAGSEGGKEQNLT
jgi:hypothetical protein